MSLLFVFEGKEQEQVHELLFLSLSKEVRSVESFKA